MDNSVVLSAVLPGNISVSERQTLRRDDQRNDYLHAIAAAIATIAEAARIALVFRHVTLKIRARQIVEQDLVTCREQIAPAFTQVREQSLFFGEQ